LNLFFTIFQCISCRDFESR